MRELLFTEVALGSGASTPSGLPRRGPRSALGSVSALANAELPTTRFLQLFAKHLLPLLFGLGV
jgi:hypothetical protein